MQIYTSADPTVPESVVVRNVTCQETNIKIERRIIIGIPMRNAYLV